MVYLENVPVEFKNLIGQFQNLVHRIFVVYPKALLLICQLPTLVKNTDDVGVGEIHRRNFLIANGQDSGKFTGILFGSVQEQPLIGIHMIFLGKGL